MILLIENLLSNPRCVWCLIDFLSARGARPHLRRHPHELRSFTTTDCTDLLYTRETDVLYAILMC